MSETYVKLRTTGPGPENEPGVPRLPAYLTIFVNWACNLSCRECWLYGDSADANDWLPGVKRDRISLEMLRSILDELRAVVARPVISLMGGEPLIHPRIIEIVELIKDLTPTASVDMSTNGTLLGRYAEPLVTSGIDTVYVSLDGPDAAINDPIRGQGSFRRAIDGLSALLAAKARAKRGPDVALNFTLTGLNYQSLPDMVVLAERLGIAQVTVDLGMYFTAAEGQSSRPAFEPVTGRPFTSWGGYENEHHNRHVDPSLLRSCLDTAVSVSAEVEVLIAPVRYDNETKSRFFTDDWRHLLSETSCPKLRGQTTILPNGDVISCTPFADTVMGSLADDTLEAIWTGRRYRELRQRLEGDLQPVCYRCCELSLDIGTDPDLYRHRSAVSPSGGDSVGL